MEIAEINVSTNKQLTQPQRRFMYTIYMYKKKMYAVKHCNKRKPRKSYHFAIKNKSQSQNQQNTGQTIQSELNNIAKM